MSFRESWLSSLNGLRSFMSFLHGLLRWTSFYYFHILGKYLIRIILFFISFYPVQTCRLFPYLLLQFLNLTLQLLFWPSGFLNNIFSFCFNCYQFISCIHFLHRLFSLSFVLSNFTQFLFCLSPLQHYLMVLLFHMIFLLL